MQQGFLQGPGKEGDGNVVHALWLSFPLTPPLPLRASNIKSQGSTWEAFAGLVLPPKLSREWKSRTPEQRAFDQHVWKPLAADGSVF